MLESLFPTKLSDEEETELRNYKGVKRTVYKDSKPLEEIDTRTVEGERLRQRKMLKVATRDGMLKKFPLHKQLNFNDLTDTEKFEYSLVKEFYLSQYNDLKTQLQNAKSAEECCNIMSNFNEFK